MQYFITYYIGQPMIPNIYRKLKHFNNNIEMAINAYLDTKTFC